MYIYREKGREEERKREREKSKMEKPAKSKNVILKYLPKAASAINFQNSNPNPFSPGRDHKRSSDATNKFKSHGGAGRGFSGPMIPMIPVEAPRRSRSGNFDWQEPTSPKVSCMGQIKSKHKKRIQKTKRVPSTKDQSKPREMKKQHSTLQRIFRRSDSRRKSDASSDDYKPPVPERAAPPLGQMRRFSSGRNAFASFDWSAPVAPLDPDGRNYYSDEERVDFEDEEDEEVIIPFSAPILVGGGAAAAALEPRKEINLWKRRPMAPPRPLRLNK